VIRNAEKKDVAQSVGLVKDGRQGVTLEGDKNIDFEIEQFII
jgi:hypothetical protein